MKKKRIIILGAGISGLSCAWYLSKLSHLSEFIVLEKEKRAGGYLQTEVHHGFLFEKSARTFKSSRCAALLDLVNGLDLTSELIGSDESAKKRYLFVNRRLQKLPWPVFSFSFFKEWFVNAKGNEEETIYDFAVRRFNEKIAQRLFDPLTVGIFAGDIRRLSMNSCFPYFKMLEEKYGSVIKGFLKEGFKTKKQTHSLFSFSGGVQTLLNALEKKLNGHLHFKEEVTKVNIFERGVEVHTTSGVLAADYVISALPVSVMGKIFESKDKEIGQLITSIRTQGLLCVHLGFKEKVLSYKGFGYLVPTSEKQHVYGAVFDSLVFPQHNQSSKETRLTVMAKENTDIQTILSEVRAHLKISAVPDFVKAVTFKDAIPQFDVGHKQKIERIKEKLLEKYPTVRLLGNYLTGPSVNDCIAGSSQLVVNLQQELLSRF